MYTEEEAKKLWCPEIRDAAHDERFNLVATVNLPFDIYTCKASKCMMWRWDEYTTREERKEGRAHGYCGKGGKP